jgi:hypothetical protein
MYVNFFLRWRPPESMRIRSRRARTRQGEPRLRARMFTTRCESGTSRRVLGDTFPTGPRTAHVCCSRQSDTHHESTRRQTDDCDREYCIYRHFSIRRSVRAGSGSSPPPSVRCPRLRSILASQRGKMATRPLSERGCEGVRSR